MNLYAGTAGGVFRSINNGANWVEVNSGLTNLYVTSIARVAVIILPELMMVFFFPPIMVIYKSSHGIIKQAYWKFSI